MTWRFALLLIFTARSWACVCSGNGPSVKQAWKDAPAVFLGTVALADPDGDAQQLMFQEQLVRIRIDEAFKGVSSMQTIELHQGANDCSAKFRTGQRYVFYLYRGATRGSWIVPWCTHSLGNAEPPETICSSFAVCRDLQSARGSRVVWNCTRTRRSRHSRGWAAFRTCG